MKGYSEVEPKASIQIETASLKVMSQADIDRMAQQGEKA